MRPNDDGPHITGPTYRELQLRIEELSKERDELLECLRLAWTAQSEWVQLSLTLPDVARIRRALGEETT